MIIKNIQIYTEEKKFYPGWIRIGEDVITEVHLFADFASGQNADEEIVDGKGAYAIPGLIDIHLHGAEGADFCDGTEEAIQRIAEYELSVGVTSMAPATMTLPVKELKAVLSTAATYKKEDHAGAELLGINMEGPFISPVKKGAQKSSCILKCDVDIANEFIDVSEGLVKFIGVAPEENPDVLQFIQALKDKVTISLAHTNADYDQAKTAFDAGAGHLVHMFNAMQGLHHRTPGMIPAALEKKDVFVELICDGIHVHPAMIRLAFQLFGEDRIILISDSMRATGLKDGQYDLGGQEVTVKGNRATLISDGSLAGSVTNLMDCMRFAVKEAQIPLEKVIASVTRNPARSLKEFENYGSLKEGKKADLVLLDNDLEIKEIVKSGRNILNRQKS